MELLVLKMLFVAETPAAELAVLAVAPVAFRTGRIAKLAFALPETWASTMKAAQTWVLKRRILNSARLRQKEIRCVSRASLPANVLNTAVGRHLRSTRTCRWKSAASGNRAKAHLRRYPLPDKGRAQCIAR